MMKINLNDKKDLLFSVNNKYHYKNRNVLSSASSASVITDAEATKIKHAEILSHIIPYYLEDNLKIKECDLFDSDGVTRTYNVIHLDFRYPGLQCHLLTSKDPGVSNMHLVFKGTTDLPGVKRDLELSGAGSESFYRFKKELINKLNNEINNSSYDEKINLSVSGHSLGGADAQNGLAAVLEAMSSKSMNANKIKKLSLNQFNSPGISKCIASEAKKNAIYIKNKYKNKINIEVNAILSQKDMIQLGGNSNILSDIDSDIANVQVIEVDYRDKKHFLSDTYSFLDKVRYFNSWSVPSALLNMYDTVNAHKLLLFDKDSIIDHVKIINNKDSHGKEQIHKLLNNKSWIDNTFLSNLPKKVLSMMIS